MVLTSAAFPGSPILIQRDERLEANEPLPVPELLESSGKYRTE